MLFLLYGWTNDYIQGEHVFSELSVTYIWADFILNWKLKWDTIMWALFP